MPRATSTRVPSGAGSREIDEIVRDCLRRGESLYRLDQALLNRLRPDVIVTQSLGEVRAVGPDEVERAIPALASKPAVIMLEPHTLERCRQHPGGRGRPRAARRGDRVGRGVRRR